VEKPTLFYAFDQLLLRLIIPLLRIGYGHTGISIHTPLYRDDGHTLRARRRAPAGDAGRDGRHHAF
jgi:hypothetical protein